MQSGDGREAIAGVALKSKLHASGASVDCLAVVVRCFVTVVSSVGQTFEGGGRSVFRAGEMFRKPELSIFAAAAGWSEAEPSVSGLTGSDLVFVLRVKGVKRKGI